MKKNVQIPGHFQYTAHYEGKSFSCPRTQKGFTSYYLHFSSFKICSQYFLIVSHLHHISYLKLLPKSYFKISTFQPNFLCSSSFNVNLFVTCLHVTLTLYNINLTWTLSQDQRNSNASGKLCNYALNVAAQNDIVKYIAIVKPILRL